MTEDLLQLLRFEEFYVTDESGIDGMRRYLDGADEAVIYIDTSVFWSSGYDAQEILTRIAAETEYTRAEPLFETGLSVTYLISK